MKFKRKFETCDPQDNTVQVNVYLIYILLSESWKRIMWYSGTYIYWQLPNTDSFLVWTVSYVPTKYIM